MAKAQTQSEMQVHFPGQKVGDYVVKPFTLGQIGTALRILTPCIAGFDVNNLTIESVNLPILMYALTANDCADVFELVSMATGENLEHIKELPADIGFDLLKAVWEVSIIPTLTLFKKKFPMAAKAMPEPAGTDSQPSSST
jgi:hypothetical protein